MDSMPRYLSIIIIVICLLASFIFTAAENAFSNCNIYHYKVLAEDGNRRAKIIYKMASKFDDSIVTVLVGNNLAQAILSNIAAIFFLAIANEQNWPNGVESIVSTAIVASVLYLFTDFLPKVISKKYPDRTIEFFIYFIFIFYYLFYPIILFFRLFLLLFKKLFKSKGDLSLTKEEFIDKAGEAKDEVLESDEKQILNKAFKFDKISVNQVLTPLEKIFSINIQGLTTSKLNKILISTNYSRIPIYDGEKDNIIGILIIRSYFREYMRDKRLSIRKVLNKPICVNVDDKVDDIFKRFNDEKTHIALVYNRKKQLVGMITMDDVLEELVGDISEKQTTIINVMEKK